MKCNIDIKSLKPGTHVFDFQLDKSFLEEFGNEFINDLNVGIQVELTKSSEWIKMNCSIKGDVIVSCDRCLDDLSLPVDVTLPFTVKFVACDEEMDEEYGDDVILLTKGEGDLDLDQIIYDYICLSLPLRKVHPEGECNPEMMQKLKEILK